MFWFFGCEACGILAPPPRIEPAPPALEGEVLTTGQPGNSPQEPFLNLKPKVQHEMQVKTGQLCLINVSV